MDKLIAMKTFVQIADSGSLTAAAEVLDKSLPSVVRMLATLENHLSIRLVNRTTRKISLTREGQRYLERCRHILSEIGEAENELSEEHDEPIGTLRVTAPVLFGRRHVNPAIINFAHRHRQVEINLVLLDRIVNIVDEGFDVAIRIGELEDSSMIAVPVGNIRRIVCASPEYLEKNGVPSSPDQLSKFNCTRHTGIGSTSHWTFYDSKKPQSVAIHGQIICNDTAATVDTCLAGLGFGMFLSYQVAPFIKQNKLTYVLTDYEPDPYPVSIIYPQSKFLATRTRLFVDWMADYLRDILNYNP